MSNPAKRGGAARKVTFGPGKAKRSEIAAPPQAPSADPLCELRFQRAITRLHALGLRANAELLIEVIEHCQCKDWLNSRLAVYGNLDPATLDALGADHFATQPLHLVTSCAPTN